MWNIPRQDCTDTISNVKMPPSYFRFDIKRIISAYISCLYFVSCDRCCVCYRVTFVWSHVQVVRSCAAHGDHTNLVKKSRGNFQNLTAIISKLLLTTHRDSSSSPMGPVSRKPQKLFGPAKLFLDNLYIKSESRGVYNRNFLDEENLCSYSAYAGKTDCIQKRFCYGFPGLSRNRSGPCSSSQHKDLWIPYIKHTPPRHVFVFLCVKE